MFFSDARWSRAEAVGSCDRARVDFSDGQYLMKMKGGFGKLQLR